MTLEKKLFLVDGAGALLSVVLLGGVIPYYESLFGMPRTTLYFLAIWPCFFVLYDAWNYKKNASQSGRFLRGIAIANFSYVMLSFGLLIYHYPQLTVLGLVYFILEIIIVGILAIIEWREAAKLDG